MAKIMTILGEIEPDQLGFTSMHEHVLFDWSYLIPIVASDAFRERLKEINDGPITMANLHSQMRFNWTNYNLRIDDEDMMVAEVNDFKESGGSALVDLTPLGSRLDVEGVKRISEKTGVHIITCTGLYYGDYISGSPPRGKDLEMLMIREIEEGIDETGIKAGHIRIGVTDLTEDTVKDLHAVARVVNETGVSAHVSPGFGVGNDGRAIAEILSTQGMDLKRLIIGRAEMYFQEFRLRKLILEPEKWGLRLDYHKELLDRGVTLSIDAFGTENSYDFEGIIWPPDYVRLAAVASLAREGYSDQIVLGVDVDFKSLTRRYGGPGYSHLTSNIIPMLRELEVSDYCIRQMMVHAPVRLLSF